MPQSEPMFGWVENRQEVARALQQMPKPLFSLEAPDAILDEPPHDVAFWVAEERLFDETLPAFWQRIGDCVGQGFARAAQDLLFLELAEKAMAGHNDRQAKMVSSEGVYSLSRVEIGQRQLGHQDGSTGVWAARAVTEIGVLARQVYRFSEAEGFDLTTYNPDMARRWGYVGLPDNLERIARTHPVQNASLVTNANAGRVALQNGWPIPVCSNQAFHRTRNKSTGICDPDPHQIWPHCMLSRGFLRLKGNRWVATMQQSWGDDPSGPDVVVLESGRTVRLPQGGFNVDMEVWDNMLARHDSWALFGAKPYGRVEPEHRLWVL